MGKIEDCWHSYSPEVTNYPKKRKIRGPQNAPTRWYPLQQEAKPSLNLQIEKQLAMGGQEEWLIAQSILPIPCPWSHSMAPGSIIQQ
jgi:hypothetical protein